MWRDRSLASPTKGASKDDSNSCQSQLKETKQAVPSIRRPVLSLEFRQNSRQGFRKGFRQGFRQEVFINPRP